MKLSYVYGVEAAVNIRIKKPPLIYPNEKSPELP
jgi:hypothetical protein